MYVRASAPRPVGGVLDDAIALYRNAMPRLWPLTLGAAVLLAIPGVYLGLLLAQARPGGAPAVFAVLQSPGYWVCNAVLMVLHLAVYGALLSALDTFAGGGEVSLRDALGIGFERLPRMLGASILLAFIFMLGFILLVIPGIYLMGIYQLVIVALVVERTGITASLSVSSRLIRGNWWRSIAIVTVAFVILFVFSLIVGILDGVAVRMLGPFGTASSLLQSLTGAALNVFLLPLLPCFLLSMYFDLKLRHEGGDLAARVDALVAR